jgi:hypothetical protein
MGLFVGASLLSSIAVMELIVNLIYKLLINFTLRRTSEKNEPFLNTMRNMPQSKITIEGYTEKLICYNLS